MAQQVYQLIINTFRVGTWLQTCVFYLLLVSVFHIILTQLQLLPIKLRLNIFRKG